MKQLVVKLKRLLERRLQYVRSHAALVFALTTIALGSSYFALSLPLGFAADEPTHAYRAYQFTQGDLLPKVISVEPGHLNDPGKRAGGELSTGFAAFTQLTGDMVANVKEGYVYPIHILKAYRHEPLENGPRAYMHFENTALYSPANYVPQILTFAAARVVNLPVVYTLYAARFAVVLFSLLCAWLMFRYLPRQWHWPFAFIVTVPTAITLGGSMSPDPIINGVAGVLIAYSVALNRQLAKGRPLATRQYGLLGLLVLWACLLKPPYALVIGVPILAVALPGMKRRLAHIYKLLAVFLPGIFAAVLWNKVIAAYTVPYRNVALIDPVVPNAHDQLQYLGHHPLTFFIATFRALTETYEGTIVGLHGLVGQHYIPLFHGAMVGVVWFITLLVLVAILPIDDKPSRSLRTATAITAAGLLVAVYFLIYLSWSPVGSSIVDGIQGRYLAPVLPLAVIVGLGLWRGIKNRWVVRGLIICMMCVIFCGLYLAAQDNAQSNYNNTYNVILIPKKVMGQLLLH